MKQRGFTLVELLVVLSITGVLAGLSFAAFARVHEKGRQATCQSNLKQIALATQQYVQDYDGRYFPARGYDLFNINNHFVGFEGVLRPYVKPLAGTDIGDYNEVPTFICPDFAFEQDNSHMFASYYFNFLSEPTLPFRTPTPNELLHLLPKPLMETNLSPDVTTWMFRENETNTPDYMPEVTSSCGRTSWWNTRHSGGSNYLFFDGHVKWLTPEEASENDCRGLAVSPITNP